MSDTYRGQLQEEDQRPSVFAIPESPKRNSNIRLVEDNFKMDITSDYTFKKKSQQSEKGKDDDVIAQWKKESEQMLLTDLFVNRPCITLVIGYIILIFLTQLSIDQNYFEVSDTSTRDFYIWTDDMTVDLDMFTVASEFFDEEGDLVDPVQAVRSQRFLPAFLLYTNVDNPLGLLRKDILLNIEKLEKAIQDYPGFKDYCLAQDEDNKTCSNVTMSTPLNVLREMNVTKELKDMGQLEIEELFRTAFETIEVKPKIMANFDKNVSGDNMTVTYMRTVITFGQPLDVNGTRYANTSDRSSDQWDLVGNFSAKLRDLVVENFSDPDEFGCKINFASLVLSLDIFLGMILNDVLFALFSVGFVFFYFIIHMKSKFLSFIGTTIILFSFPITVCITEGIGGVTYVGSLQVIAIYMVLGIAADDIFVFIDAWKRSANLSDEVFQGSKQKRMAYAFRSSARAMAITSSTTSVAFFANIFSPLLPIKTFGIFSGVIIPVNFFLVVVFMPPAVIIYEEYIEDAYICCFKCKSWRDRAKKVQKDDREQLGQNDEENENEDATNSEAHQSSDKEKKEGKLGTIEKFFDGPINKFVYKFRKQISIASLIWFFYACGQAFQLGPQTEQEEFIDPEHPAVIVYSKMSSEFPAPVQRLEAIDIYWGVKGIDRTGESQWDPLFIGAPIFDKTFDVTTVRAQKWFIDLCDELNKQSFVTYDNVKCWMKDFEKYVEEELEEKFPIRSKRDFMKFLNIWIDDEDDYLGTFYSKSKYFGISDNEIIFTKINAKSTLGKRSSGEEKKVEYEKWQEFIEDQRGMAPPEMNNFRQTTGAWPQIATESAFVENALQGVVISIFFAFIILLYATGNIIQSVVSIWCVTIVIVTIMTIMRLRDLKLGTAESISLVVLIGFSVDYIVHLSADYMHSAHIKRYDKMRQAYREMGVSILSGCLTTFGCGFCLFFGNFTFFQTFGLVVTCTVGTSFVVAMFTFGALCHLWGPEGQYGMLVKTTKEETKEDRDEIEMRLVQIDDASSEHHEKVQAKITELNEKQIAQFDTIAEEMDEVRKDMKKERQRVKNLLNQILEASEKPKV